MAGWTKLEHSILQSTIWDAPNHVRIVWITLLALQDKNGYVGSSIPGLAHEARVSVEETEEAINRLESPDKYSRSPEHDGRRIEKTDRGWKILNSEKFRGELREEKIKEQTRERVARYRAKKAATESDVTQCNAGNVTVTPVTHVTHNKNKNKNKKDLPDPSLRSGSDPIKNIVSSLGSQEGDPFLLAPTVLTKADQKKEKTPASRVFKSYELGYEDHYGVKPKRNAKNYAHCKELVKRLGVDEAIALAEWYPFYRNSYHVGRGHALGCLVADCETVYTAMVTGHQITSSRARDEDRLQETGQVWKQLIAKHGE